MRLGLSWTGEVGNGIDEIGTGETGTELDW